MIVLSISDPRSVFLNEYMLQISKVACSNSAYEVSRFTELKDTVRQSIKLENEYYSCDYNDFDVISFAVGIGQCKYY